MNTSKIHEWLSIGASVAVFLGLLLVAYEIRQANEIAFAEMRNEVNSDWLTITTDAIALDIASLQKKALAQPDQLTDEEIDKLNAWLSGIMVVTHKQAVLHFDFGWAQDPSEFASTLASEVFSSLYGRAWYLENRGWHPQLIEVIDSEIASLPIANEWHSVESIRKRMAELSGE